MKKFSVLILLSAILALSTNYVFGQIVVRVKPVKPNKVLVVKPKAPGMNYFWVSGHWVVKQGKYYWVDGYWKRKKRNHVWIAGHWTTTPRGYKWIPGHWKRV